MWTQPQGAAFGALEVELTVENARTRSIMSVAEIVLTLLLGAWIGVVADRFLLAGRRRAAPPSPSPSPPSPFSPSPSGG